MKTILGLVFISIIYFISPANADYEWEGSCYIKYDGQVVVNNEKCYMRQNVFFPTMEKHINETSEFQILVVKNVLCDDGSNKCAYFFYLDKFLDAGEIGYQINYNIDKEFTRHANILGEDFKISDYKANNIDSGYCFFNGKDKFCFEYIYKGS